MIEGQCVCVNTLSRENHFNVIQSKFYGNILNSIRLCRFILTNPQKTKAR